MNNANDPKTMGNGNKKRWIYLFTLFFYTNHLLFLHQFFSKKFGVKMQNFWCKKCKNFGVKKIVVKKWCKKIGLKKLV